MAGYGVGMAVKHIFAAAFGERNFSSDLIDLMVQDGRQGMLLDCFPCDYDLCILPSITDTKLAIHELTFFRVYCFKVEFCPFILQERAMAKVITFMRRAGSQSLTLVFNM